MHGSTPTVWVTSQHTHIDGHLSTPSVGFPVEESTSPEKNDPNSLPTGYLRNKHRVTLMHAHTHMATHAPTHAATGAYTRTYAPARTHARTCVHALARTRPHAAADLPAPHVSRHAPPTDHRAQPLLPLTRMELVPPQLHRLRQSSLPLS
eukprot:GHVU01141907.1.p1 GENE.GHVU01141907.1~~GHVU01141907.1.p1  ORF type:complete len:150 (+),score=4.03 GHVU01141907.1:435-884(+)